MKYIKLHKTFGEFIVNVIQIDWRVIYEQNFQLYVFFFDFRFCKGEITSLVEVYFELANKNFAYSTVF